MYEPFETAAWNTDRDETIENAYVQPHESGAKAGMVMEIITGDVNVYITKEQAMKFFGLVDPNENTVNTLVSTGVFTNKE